jgi:hypothetical protein
VTLKLNEFCGRRDIDVGKGQDAKRIAPVLIFALRAINPAQ